MAGRILRLKALIEQTGLSRSAIYDRMDEKSPRYAPDFPKSFSLGGSAVGWWADEVDQWLEKCAAQAKDGITPKKSNVTVKAQASATTKKPPPFPKPSTKLMRAPRDRSVGETLVAGEKINARILGYLQMPTWTPVMGALLISGIAPPVDCIEIPDGGSGLEGKPLHASNARFHEARRILQEWQYREEDSGIHIKSLDPADFLIWCIDEEINTDWLALVLEVAGCDDGNSAEVTAARLALLAGTR